MQSKTSSQQLLSSFLAGSIIGALEISFVLAYATLLFGQSLTPYLGQGIGILLTGTIVSVIIIASLSSYQGSISGAQDIPATLLSVMITNFTLHFSQNGGVDEASFDTVITLLIITTLITALLLLVMAKFKLGKIIRLIPFPVIGGLLASTGWVLTMVGFSMLVNETISYQTINKLFSMKMVTLWIPGLVIALTILIASRKLKSPLTFPVVVFLSFLFSHLLLWLNGVSIADAKAMGLLLNIESDSLSFGINIQKVVSSADMSLVLSEFPLIISLCLLSVIIVMVQVSSLEVVISKDMNMNKELFANGIANLGVGMVGGLISYHHISRTTIAYRLGAKTRLVGIICAFFCILPFLFGTDWLGYFPVPVLAGIILYLGLDFLYDWLVLSLKRIPIWEYLILIIIFFTVILFNFPLGIAVGVICGVALFVVRYSRINIIDKIVTGDACKSVVIRSPEETFLLNSNVNAITLVKLKGFMFFGTSDNLFEQIKKYITDYEGKIKTLVLDFKNISQIDYTAIIGLARTYRLLDEKDIQLLFSNVNSEDMALIKKIVSDDESSDKNFYYDSTDQAIEAAENNLLTEAGIEPSIDSSGITMLLTEAGLSESEVAKVQSFATIYKTKDGDFITKTGSLEKSFYIVDKGKVAIYQDRAGKKVRLRVLTAGMVVGEMAVYSDLPRSADIISHGDATVMELSSESLTLLEERHSEIAFKIHRLLGRRLSQMVLDDSILQMVRN